MKVTQNCWRYFASARISRANKPFAPFVGHADRAQTKDAAAPSPLTIQVPRVCARREDGNLCIHLFCVTPHFFCNFVSFFLLEESEDKSVHSKRRTLRNKTSHDQVGYFVGRGITLKEIERK